MLQANLTAIALLGTLLAAPKPAFAQATGEETAREIRAAEATLPADAAKALFGAAREPAPLAARSIGAYSRGCLAGAKIMPVSGPAWQVMRLGRNRNWGHPELIAYLERFALAARQDGWPGLLVGDLAQPRGGPMLTGHASHQTGLDADVWLMKMPNRELSAEERETIGAISVLKDGTREINPKVWTEDHARLIRRAALDGAVSRIFVHPGIKKALCAWRGAGEATDGGERGAGGNRGWLHKIRPWHGHHYHFHIRLACPVGLADCKDQEPIPAGDGCGAELDWWLGPEPWKPMAPTAPAPPMTLADLPPACRQVLVAK